jgi:phosphate uptake regulator
MEGWAKMKHTTIRLETKKIAVNLSNMTKLIIKNHVLASKAIKTNDKNLAIEILEKDKIVDAEFYQIESDLEFMITKALVDKDLRRVLASLHIVKELERIGDYAKKISKFIIKIDKISASSIRRITKVQDKFKKMIEKVPKIIIDEDTKLAKEI